jgi:putative restriction endonuclease
VIVWIGITDSDWFEQLSRDPPVEANFWQPSGGVPFRALEPGGLFLFKLHSPQNFVVGGGWFVRHSALPVSIAWKAFDTNNGVRSHAELLARVRRYTRDRSSPDPFIGCNILERPFFWSREQWINLAGRWARNIVRGRTYDTAKEDGAILWAEVRARLDSHFGPEDEAPNLLDLNNYGPRWSREFLTRTRLGQGAFRVLVTEAYRRRCALTSERTLPVLEAAHIQPYAESGPHRLSNGFLLRSDIHTLFDLGYVTVTPELRVQVSRRIKSEFENGRAYYQYDGAVLTNLPEQQDERPGAAYLRWHNENRFQP